MTPEPDHFEFWRRLEAVFIQVLELPPDQREAFIRETRATDDEMRHALEVLLANEFKESAVIAGIIDEAANSLFEGADDIPVNGR